MYFPFRKEIEYFEVDGAFRLKPGVLFRLMQESAIRHSRQVGYDTRHLNETGFAWILARYGVEIRRPPEYGEEVEFVTWSRGVDGFRAYRDFRVQAGGATIAAATSLWVYLDLATKRVRRIPEAVVQRYTAETEQALPWAPETWSFPTRLPTAGCQPLSTRAGDIDTNGHVNNAVYVEYLETALARQLGRPVRFRTLRLQFEREIEPTVPAVHVLLEADGGRWRFLLTDPAAPERRFARGDCELTEA
jgi:acyl-ACP thioesterase